MASVPLSVWSDPSTREASAKPSIVGVTAPARLTALEWSVVAMAERDGLSSLREPGRVGRALISLFGLTPANKLANPQLEALRRVAVHAWRSSWNIPDSELKAFLAAGYSMDQYELLQASIHKGRESRDRKARSK